MSLILNMTLIRDVPHLQIFCLIQISIYALTHARINLITFSAKPNQRDKPQMTMMIMIIINLISHDQIDDHDNDDHDHTHLVNPRLME